jgi:hypothetical protein
MYKAIVACALAAGLIPASASATDFTINWTSGVYNPTPPIQTSPGNYSDTYKFGLASPADFSGALTTQRLRVNGETVSDLDFTSVVLTKTSGSPFTPLNFTVPLPGSDALEVVNLVSTPLTVGDYLLTVNYSVNPASMTNGASYGGTLNSGRLASAAPEAATWAMFVVGFGAIGGTLRSKRRVMAPA